MLTIGIHDTPVEVKLPEKKGISAKKHRCDGNDKTAHDRTTHLNVTNVPIVKTRERKKKVDARPSFNAPQQVIALPSGELLVADRDNYRIRLIDTDGSVSTLFGISRRGHQDGNRQTARIGGPRGMCLTTRGTVLFADGINNAIREISSSLKTITTIAGVSSEGFRDGAAISAQFSLPLDVLEIRGGWILVTDSMNHVIRAISAPDKVI